MIFNRLFGLFIVFLKCGLFGFGGHLSLIPLIKHEVVHKRGWCSEEDILDAVAFSSIVPGPIVVNSAVFIAYRSAGLLGGFLALLGLILPCFLMMILAAIYYRSVQINAIGAKLLFGFSCCITGIVGAMFFTLGRAQIKGIKDGVLSSLCLLSMVFAPGIWGAVFCVALAFGFGLCAKSKETILFRNEIKPNKRDVLAVLAILSLIFILLIVPEGMVGDSLGQEIGRTFGSLALMTFGGGYVAIPLLKEAIVDQHSWLSPEAFSHALSLGQITPGPISITAAFVGYFLKGFSGALIGTIYMFVPTALLMVLASNFSSWMSSFNRMVSVAASFRSAAVGMIGAATIFLAQQIFSGQEGLRYLGIALSISTLVVSMRWPKISTAIVILIGGFFAVILG